MSAHAARHIVIIGGGFSGTMAAVNLARLSRVPLRVTLVNHAYPPGRGIAYGTRRPEHLLNVAARNLSALPEHPNHFLDWLRTRSEFSETPEAELRETFLPRRLYGDYLRSLALHYTQSADRRSAVQVECVQDEALAIEPQDGRAAVILASGQRLTADKVLLATGNEPPTDLPGGEALANHPAYCANPWLDWEGKLPPVSESIVLLGTGLTTVDAIVTLLALDWRGTIHAVSRHGLLPQSHFKGIEYSEFPPAGVDVATLGLESLAKLIAEHCTRLRGRHENPAIIVDKMRPHTQRVWQAFSDVERRQFCQRHAARWNVIRHRIAPTIHQQVTAALAQGRLTITSSAITQLESDGPRIRVQLRDRDDRPAYLNGALVINCTGPHTRFSATRSRLLQNLLASGLAQPDSMDMGVRVDSDFTVITRDGKRSEWLLAIGPLLRGTLWESIAVPELRGQALRVAQTLLDENSAPSAPAARWAEAAEPATLEYCI